MKESVTDIIISESPARLAAAELQTYVAKISNTRLPSKAEPSAKTPVRVYVGESPYAAKLGVTADRLGHGAYRIASGEKWLVLIGDDTAFTPKEPWPRRSGPRSHPRGVRPIGRRHAMQAVLAREKMKREHPDYYAIWAAQRKTDYLGEGAPCLSS
jgi:hypothetical protein